MKLGGIQLDPDAVAKRKTSSPAGKRKGGLQARSLSHSAADRLTVQHIVR